MEDKKFKETLEKQASRLDSMKIGADGTIHGLDKTAPITKTLSRKINFPGKSQKLPMNEPRKLEHQEELTASAQEVVLELRKSELDAVYDRGRSELMTAYEKDIDLEDKRRAISRIKSASHELEAEVGILVASLARPRNFQAGACVVNGNRMKNTFLAKVQKCTNLANRMRSELTSADIFAVYSQNVAREDIARQADDILGDVVRGLNGIRENFADPNTSFEESIRSAMRTTEELTKNVLEAHKKVKEIPLAAVEHKNFNDVIRKTVEEISNNTTLPIESLNQQFQDLEALTLTHSEGSSKSCQEDGVIVRKP